MNTGKTKVMVSAVGSGEIRGTGDSPCGVCDKEVGANSITCTRCRKWIHKRCSDITGSLSRVKDDFICAKCKGTLPRPSVVGDGEFLEVEGEKYGVVTSFCYLGDTIDGNGGASAAITTRIQCGWKKFNELAPFLTSRAPSLKMKGRVYNACVRSCLLYGSETWPMTTENERRLKTADTRMTKKLCGNKLCKTNSTEDLRKLTGLEEITESLRKRRLR